MLLVQTFIQAVLHPCHYITHSIVLSMNLVFLLHTKINILYACHRY